VNFDGRDREPDPGSRSRPIPEAVRRAIDGVASWVHTELGLVVSGVRTMTRDVQAMIADVKDVFSALSVRLALVETRLTAIEERETPASPPEGASRCRRRARRRRPRGPSCQGRAPDH
jgi:hypothetical protein